jgi:hypothetical protein
MYSIESHEAAAEGRPCTLHENDAIPNDPFMSSAGRHLLADTAPR